MCLELSNKCQTRKNSIIWNTWRFPGKALFSDYVFICLDICKFCMCLYLINDLETTYVYVYLNLKLSLLTLFTLFCVPELLISVFSFQSEWLPQVFLVGQVCQQRILCFCWSEYLNFFKKITFNSLIDI